MTGDLGVELPWTSGSVTHTLNDHDQIDVVASLDALDGVSREWWSPRSGCLVVTYSDGWGVERIVSAGVIASPPKDDRQARTTTFTARGVTGLLEDRIILDRDYEPGASQGLRTSKIVCEDQTYRAIMGTLVRTGLAKRNGWLPIITPPAEAGNRSRTYAGYDVANNAVWKRIQELSEADGGPDFAFRAEWADDEHTRFQWRLIAGSDAQATLPQDGEVLWDATSRDGDVATLDPVTSDESTAHRVYATGSGSGSTVGLEVAELETLTEFDPLVEKVVSASSAEPNVGGVTMLVDVAKGALASVPIYQLSLQVHADLRRKPIGTWWCGELALVATEGWRDFPNGEFRLLAISVKYTLGSDMADVEFQEDYMAGGS
ncbi:hypothetical protein ACFSDA_15290 [Brachybacterium rhamnosum]|uniref:Minor tail protein n=1 Tax=Brachybacterium rhamnosum TaxID=173361 RepID=A0ABW4Q047_9MICO